MITPRKNAKKNSSISRMRKITQIIGVSTSLFSIYMEFKISRFNDFFEFGFWTVFSFIGLLLIFIASINTSSNSADVDDFIIRSDDK